MGGGGDAGRALGEAASPGRRGEEGGGAAPCSGSAEEARRGAGPRGRCGQRRGRDSSPAAGRSGEGAPDSF